jgi:hypothetical protein
MARIITTAINAAIKPYSTAVTPRLSLLNLAISANILLGLVGVFIPQDRPKIAAML